jgi:MFS family permease
VYGLLVNACWPALEVAIFDVDSRLSTPKRLSIYNITWSVANTLGLLASSLFVGWMPAAVVWGPGLLYAASTLLLIPKPSTANHTLAAPSAPTPSVAVAPGHKRRFMHAAWLGNALAYVMIAVLLPLLPALGDRLGQSPSLTIVLAAAFYLTRALSFVLYGHWEGWHYHRGWNRLALAVAPLAFAGVMLTSSPALILVSLAVFGAALGLIYSCSLFYSLDYSAAKGEYGGLHEAIIGIGNLGGPLVGLAGVRWIGDPHGAPWATLAVVAIGTLVAISLLPGIHRSGKAMI